MKGKKMTETVTAHNVWTTETVLENYRARISEGFNTGIKASKGNYIVLPSNDMTVDRGLLKPVIKLMETDPQVGLVGFKRLAHGTTNLLDGIGGNLFCASELSQ
jgi:cellulose synthase/poly-beta-1,6-N-acetylglucosamine synthase-like glycosyltransferase